jgi:hypothetical protein
MRPQWVTVAVQSRRQALVHARRGRVDLGRRLHREGLMRTLVIEAAHKRVETRLLLEEIGGRRFGGFAFEREMHPLVPAIFARDAPAECVRSGSPAAATRRRVY